MVIKTLSNPPRAFLPRYTLAKLLVYFCFDCTLFGIIGLEAFNSFEVSCKNIVNGILNFKR